MLQVQLAAACGVSRQHMLKPGNDDTRLLVPRLEGIHSIMHFATAAAATNAAAAAAAATNAAAADAAAAAIWKVPRSMSLACDRYVWWELSHVAEHRMLLSRMLLC